MAAGTEGLGRGASSHGLVPVSCGCLNAAPGWVQPETYLPPFSGCQSCFPPFLPCLHTEQRGGVSSALQAPRGATGGPPGIPQPSWRLALGWARAPITTVRSEPCSLGGMGCWHLRWLLPHPLPASQQGDLGASVPAAEHQPTWHRAGALSAPCDTRMVPHSQHIGDPLHTTAASSCPRSREA